MEAVRKIFISPFGNSLNLFNHTISKPGKTSNSGPSKNKTTEIRK